MKLKKILIIGTLLLSSFNIIAKEQSEKINIDIISDVVCPWCAVGYKRLNTAIEELNMENDVNIVFHPFELNPNMPEEGINADSYLSRKYRLTPEELKNTRERVTKLGEDAGFKFSYFEDMKKTNTFNAHILLDYAKEFDKQIELKIRLQNAYFNEHKNIGNREVLRQELINVGLDPVEGMKRLDDILIREKIYNEEEYWKSKGVSAIPTIVFDNLTSRQGARSVEYYKEILTSLVAYKKSLSESESESE